jgi:A/G-specific adenine glycosylase
VSDASLTRVAAQRTATRGESRRDPLARRLLAWYDRNGRKRLPWKRSRDAYAIWVSEIMLQQTQVATVVPYYERFLRRFPTVQKLARAKPNDVLHLWTGLGYYARARHLHQAARQVVHAHGGKFPRDFESVAALPGVGRSTAGAILALAYGARHAILDGNVKRVLARVHAIGTPLDDRVTQARLWALAEAHTPRARVADYTQAVMDLGAIVCRRRNPDCARCPLRDDCRAAALGTPQAFPATPKRRARPVRRVNMLLIRDSQERVLLVQRPPVGLWGGLWCLPECEQSDVRGYSRAVLGLEIAPASAWPAFRHSFSHFHLDITPIPAHLLGTSAQARETTPTAWYKLRRPDARGMPAPAKKLIQQLRKA